MGRFKQAERPQAQTLRVYADPEAEAAAMAERKATRERERAEAKERGKLIRKARAEKRRLAKADKTAANKAARAKALAEATPALTGLFTQHATATEDTQLHEQALLWDDAIPQDARRKLSTVIDYLIENHKEQLHYAKIHFDSTAVLRCLLQVDSMKQLQVLATMKSTNGQQFWLNRNPAPLGAVLQTLPIKNNEHLGYSFSLSSGVSSYTKRIPNIELRNASGSTQLIYSSNDTRGTMAPPGTTVDERALPFTMGHTLAEYMHDITQQIPTEIVEASLFPVFHYLLQRDNSELHFCVIMYQYETVLNLLIQLSKTEGFIRLALLRAPENEENNSGAWANLCGDWAKPQHMIPTREMQPIHFEGRGFAFQLYNGGITMYTNHLPAVSHSGMPYDPDSIGYRPVAQT